MRKSGVLVPFGRIGTKHCHKSCFSLDVNSEAKVRTVGFEISEASGIFTSFSFFISVINWTAFNEWPPKSKKLSSIPIVSTESTFFQSSRTYCSVSLVGFSITLEELSNSFRDTLIRLFISTFPLLVNGISSTLRIISGTI